MRTFWYLLGVVVHYGDCPPHMEYTIVSAQDRHHANRIAQAMVAHDSEIREEDDEGTYFGEEGHGVRLNHILSRSISNAERISLANLDIAFEANLSFIPEYIRTNQHN